MNAKRRISSVRSGMALMLVIPAVALAAVLAYAVLANTGMQQQISANAGTIAQADCLAESGINYALYNLQNPSNAPGYTGNGFIWPGGTISSLGGIPGSVNISVTTSATNQYLINSTANVSGPNGGSIARTISISVQALPTYGNPNEAAGLGGGLSPASGATVTVNGDLRVSGAATLNSGSSVSGNVYASSLTLAGGTDSSFVQTTASAAAVAPTAVTSYLTYTLNGATHSATLLTTDPVAGTVLGPTVSNPAGVYYTQNRTATLKGVTINGTLIVNGNYNLNISGSSTNKITPMANFPGLVANDQIVMVGANNKLTVNGLVWAKAGLNGATGNSGNIVTINGSLFIPSTSTNGINSFSGALNLNYTPQNINVPNFSSQLPMSNTIKVLSWSEVPS